MARIEKASFESLVTRVRDTLQKYGMLTSDVRVLLAVSGGPDSMCLLHVFCHLGIPFEVAHFDHQTREGESAADAEFVREECQKLNVVFHLGTAVVAEFARQEGLSFEEGARQLRYTFLVNTCRATGCNAIATGHHADDQAETVLMRLLRGTSPEGLCGIPPTSEKSGVIVIRPLIECTRDEIMAALQERNIPYRLDKTNAATCYIRNRIRHELLPLLRARYNPRIDEALRRYAEIHREENEYLDEAARDRLKACLDSQNRLCREELARSPVALQRRAILLWAYSVGLRPSFERIEAVRRSIVEGVAGSQCDFGANVSVGISKYKAEFLFQEEVPDLRGKEGEHVLLQVPGETRAFGKVFCVRVMEKPPGKDMATYCNSFRQVFDADRLPAPVIIRKKRSGDVFIPLGMSGRKSLKKYLSELGIPPTERREQLLLVAGEEVAWVIGHMPAAPFSVTERTRRFIEVNVREDG
ncbi:MAG TPA: tRNA lysidine(34) synthetase TilS [Candidatus Hydrogenedentes bacterium]|nr:tRNA lysidine(34) synthetase TilS [Candidatus Hydrogenedentota bacterium]HOL76163.1 tRNA lysidine(34) synthetase TilS [Candidatus Hydrogenedentota bacterium]HPO84778.1 tRNA lysidine(34) synthetase TilS [Candidatus Hydrogenedentota bacterium]